MVAFRPRPSSTFARRETPNNINVLRHYRRLDQLGPFPSRTRLALAGAPRIARCEQNVWRTYCGRWIHDMNARSGTVWLRYSVARAASARPTPGATSRKGSADGSRPFLARGTNWSPHTCVHSSGRSFAACERQTLGHETWRRTLRHHAGLQMRDTKWISYFRQAVLLATALPGCGGSVAGAGETGGVPGSAESGIPPVSNPSAHGSDGGDSPNVAPAADPNANPFDSSLPQDATPTAIATCTWSDGPATGNSSCGWTRIFQGDPTVCLGQFSAYNCDAVCGQPAAYCVYTAVCSDSLSCGEVSCQAQLDCPVQVKPTPGNGGRRSGYFASIGFGPPPTGREIGTHFARVACMEAGSVEAFRLLRDELSAHRAPKRLVKAASRAIRDEIRHVRQTSALARRFGEEPIAPHPAPPREIRPLVEMAIENAAEGCVRETYSALECAWQAQLATDPVVRATMSRIARDEMRHLALAWRVHAWALGRLDTAARERVREAKRGAIAVLKDELRADPHTFLLGQAGLPTAFHSLVLVEAIEAKVAA